MATKRIYLKVGDEKVRACNGSDSLRGKQDTRETTVSCPSCDRVYLAAACQTVHGTPVIPRHRAVPEGSRLAQAIVVAVLTLVFLLAGGAASATSPTYCPSYGSYANYCVSGGGTWWSAFYWDCAGCCSGYSKDQVCDCTDETSHQACISRTSKNEADCYSACDSQEACSPADPYCPFAPSPQEPPI